MGPGQMARQAKCLLYENKDLKLSPHAKLGVEVHLSVSSARGGGGVETGGSQDLAGWQSSRNGVLQLQQETLWQEARWKAVEENS